MSGNENCDDDDDDDESLGSSDEALLEMLGLSSLKEVSAVTDECNDPRGATEVPRPCQPTADRPPPSKHLPALSNDWLESTVATPLTREKYGSEAVFRFPDECSVSAKHMRVLTEEIVRGADLYKADRTYEGIKILKDGEIFERKTLTRLENFVDAHPGWNELCHGYLPRILSAALGVEMVLFKEKLNLKPPGGR